LSTMMPACQEKKPSEPSKSTDLQNGSEVLSEIDIMIQLPYFHQEYFSRYIAYMESNLDLTLEQVVTHVNVGLDFPYYSEEIMSEALNIGTNLFLVNKYHYLTADFVPAGLVTIAKDCTTRNLSLSEEAARAFEDLCRAAKKAGYPILGMSAYRSYAYQQNLYNSYLAVDDQATVDTYSARPGHSEHQTGLAIDVQDNTLPYNQFSETPSFQWALDNLHTYGFIIHYTPDKKFETGFMSEPWHFRYVGKEVATYLYTHNKNHPDDTLSLDEYIAREISKPYSLAITAD
ncbi:MAG TPA: hypothetical protein DCY75_01080, partial [Clostridiales bacterium]|nr:hypothetical protein [Clostridiales bacterium]